MYIYITKIGGEDLRFLHFSNKELDKDTDWKAILQGKFRHQKRKSGGLWPEGAEALIFVQRAVCKL
jgi:hypothetical protein